DITTTLWAIFAGTIFLVLVSFLAYYGYKVFLLLRIDSSFGMLFSSRTTSSPVKILAFSAIIFLIYTSRSIYDYVTAADVGVFFISVGFQWNPDGAVFLLFLIWEILPLTFVILFFWKLPSTNQMSSRDSIETPESIDDETQPLNSTISIQVPDTSPHPPFMGTTPGKSPNFSWVDEYTDPSSSQNSFNTPAHQYFSRVASTGFIPYAVTPVSSSDARNALAVPHEMSCTPGYSTFPQSAFHSSSVDDD
ncbi:MAG: hypothetical protein Q8P67_24990, partial [archaeon]|nr:hypothetical protein [archaeon]